MLPDRVEQVVDMDGLCALAVEAGALALQLCRNMNPAFKADGSYVTEVDRGVEDLIRIRLMRDYPEFGFLGEETGRSGKTDGPLWAVDPIDGTTNLVFGIPFWCVSIGLIDDGVAVAGAVCAPRLNTVWSAIRGGGAWQGNVQFMSRGRTSLHAEDTVGFTSAAIKNLDTGAMPGRVRCLGSIALDLVYAATGSLTALVGLREGAYDMAAALCIAAEAGCVAEYLAGGALDINRILAEGATHAPFVVGPAETVTTLRGLLVERSGPFRP
ncbi:MAG: inositol monophosphatase [Armatimonadetes bacterium]|nr:inositol monophosphatase [Armatimonadota bacterium]MDE2205393.1 inositol monophosphatase [Armatimonadota bacterium]